MAIVPALPGQDFGGTLSALPIRPPFYRKPWDNPVRYKLNRQYGDEFEYANPSQVRQRWQLHTTTIADIRCEGSSSIQWRAAGDTYALFQALPPYDFDAVLEFSRDFAIGGNPDNWPGLGVVDVSGNGWGVGVHQDGNIYTNALSSWNNGALSFGHGVASGLSADNRHEWICLRRTGNSIQGRASNDGVSWGSFMTADTVSNPAYLAIMRYRFSNGASQLVTLHRFNVYAAPGYFPA